VPSSFASDHNADEIKKQELTKMKKHTMTTFAAVVMAAGMYATAAQAEQKISAKVPFSFRVGDSMVQPGAYEILADQGHVIIRHSDGRTVALAMLATSGSVEGPTKLVFDVIAGNHFLVSIHDGGHKAILPVTREELRLMREGVSPTRVAMTPNGRMVAAD
jgi:hypothetical protein